MMTKVLDRAGAEPAKSAEHADRILRAFREHRGGESSVRQTVELTREEEWICDHATD